MCNLVTKAVEQIYKMDNDQLNELIDANLGEHPEQSAQLKDIIEDWANLKIESFENRRSWVRSPGQKKTDD